MNSSFRARWRRAPLAAYATVAVFFACAFDLTVVSVVFVGDWSPEVWLWVVAFLAGAIACADAHAVLAGEIAELEEREKREKLTARLLNRIRHPEPESLS